MSKHKVSFWGSRRKRKRKKKIGNVFEEIMAKNVPYLKKEKRS